jgi:hypothetical protein
MNEGKKTAAADWLRLALLLPLACVGAGSLTSCRGPTERSDASASAGSSAPSSLPGGQPSGVPVASAGLNGAAIDLSTVMGRAHGLANAWQTDAALLGVEAELSDGKIQTQSGGAAKVTFGPSPFASASPRSGLFVVTYDKSGIHGAPVSGTPGKALPEPMCAPEGVLPRVPEFKGSPITLRYGLDGADRPAWLVSLPGDPKPLRAFAPHDCSPRGTFIARPRH